MKCKNKVALLMAVILIGTLPIKVNASENEENITQMMEDKIVASTVLDEDDYSVREISANEIPENVVPLQFDTVEEAMAYLEEYEMAAPFEVTVNNCNAESSGNPLARAKETYNCTYERKLTSCYTLYATVDVDNVTKKISNTYDMKFELSGITISIGIDNVDVKATYYDDYKEVRVRAEYQHITYLLVETSALEIARSNCYQQMYYSYDDGCHDGEFGYR